MLIVTDGENEWNNFTVDEADEMVYLEVILPMCVNHHHHDLTPLLSQLPKFDLGERIADDEERR